MARGRLFHVHCGRATLAFALGARGASAALGDVFRQGYSRALVLPGMIVFAPRRSWTPFALGSA